MAHQGEQNATAPEATEPSAPVTLACLSPSALAQRLPEWDDLARDASEPNPFYESWYLLPSLRNLATGGAIAVLCLESAGKLTGLMPLVRSARYYRWPLPHFANWLHDNAFCGAPLVARGAEEAFWRALLGWADDNSRSALFLHLKGLTLGGPLHLALDRVLEGSGRGGAVVHRETRALLQSDSDPATYLETALGTKKRKELRRQARRLEDEGKVAIERQDDGEGVQEWCMDFLALEQGGWKGRAGSALASAPATRSLFCDSLTGAAARGRLERLSLTLDGKPIAMLASFLCPPGAFSYKTAYDESYARFSPGVLLQQANLAMLERRDIAWTDSCASADHPMIDHLWRERRTIGRISIPIGGLWRKALARKLIAAEITRTAPGSTP